MSRNESGDRHEFEQRRFRWRRLAAAAGLVALVGGSVGGGIALDRHDHDVAARDANPVEASAACAIFTPSDFARVFGGAPTATQPDGGPQASSCSYDFNGVSPALQVTEYRGAQAQSAAASFGDESTKPFGRAAPGARLAGYGGNGAQAEFTKDDVLVEFDYNLNNDMRTLAQAVRVAYDTVSAHQH